jgi:alcohol dehydrogenase class IV
VDDRTAEMLEFAGLPHVHSKEWNAAPEKRAFLAARLKEYNAQESLAKYNQRVERFRALLKELGLRNQSELRSN